MEGNPRAYMTMRDYRNLAWQNQQPLGRNPNPCRYMRDYRDQWMSAPVHSVPSTYAPPVSPHFTSTPQPPQPPQLISPVEQAILNLRKLVDNFKEEQMVVNVQANQEINTVENSLDQQFDGLQSEMDKKMDNLQCSISKLAQQLDHPEEESQEEECLSDTMVEESCLQQPQEGLIENFESSDIGAAVCLWEKKEATSPLLIEESSGQETMEGVQEPIIQQIPINPYPGAFAQPQNSPLPVYILPTPAAKSKPTAPAPKAHVSPSLPVQNFKRLVATIQTFATTSKTMAAAHTAWHSGWFGCRFRFGAFEPRHL